MVQAVNGVSQATNTNSPVVQRLRHLADNEGNAVRLRAGLPIFLVILTQLFDWATTTFALTFFVDKVVELNPNVISILSTHGALGFLAAKVALIFLLWLLYEWRGWIVTVPAIVIGVWLAIANTITIYRLLGL